jgi:Holliday junction resolvasome RuvABC endonuclease subunit
MNILALDLGTKTGYCHTLLGSVGWAAGTWELAVDKEVTAWGKQRITRRRDPRVTRLRDKILALPKPDLIVFEDVEFQTYTYQTQLWSSFRAAAWLAYGEEVAYECVPVSTLKKFATGSGSADKTGMRRALIRRFPELCLSPKTDDNAVDAIWIYKWAETNLIRLPRR